MRIKRKRRGIRCLQLRTTNNAEAKYSFKGLDEEDTDLSKGFDGKYIDPTTNDGCVVLFKYEGKQYKMRPTEWFVVDNDEVFVMDDKSFNEDYDLSGSKEAAITPIVTFALVALFTVSLIVGAGFLIYVGIFG